MTGPVAPVSFAPAVRPRIPVGRFGDRLARAEAGVAAAGMGALLVAVGPDLAYLAGYEAMPLERLTMLVIAASGRATLLVPRLEAAPARACPGVVRRRRSLERSAESSRSAGTGNSSRRRP